jgi:hypothetical protein
MQAPLVRKDRALVLEPLALNVTGPEAFPDLTGYEAFVNKIHLDDFIEVDNPQEPTTLDELIKQGVKAVITLANRLKNYGNYRLILSLDPEMSTMTLRFFEHREGEKWGPEDPDQLQNEEILIVDTQEAFPA